MKWAETARRKGSGGNGEGGHESQRACEGENLRGRQKEKESRQMWGDREETRESARILAHKRERARKREKDIAREK